MARKQKSAGKRPRQRSPQRFIFYLNILLAVGIISLCVYDYSEGNSFTDNRPGPRVLSAQVTPTPTPTFVPKMP